MEPEFEVQRGAITRFPVNQPVERRRVGKFSVRIYDSSNEAYFDGTPTIGAEFPDGVGSGFVTFELDEDGAPVGFLFSPDATRFDELPIAIARPEPSG